MADGLLFIIRLLIEFLHDFFVEALINVSPTKIIIKPFFLNTLYGVVNFISILYNEIGNNISQKGRDSMKKFLTATDKKIEEFIAKHSDVVLSSSIHVLADEIGVSSSSISKYIKKIGFRSYSRFKVNLAQQNSQSIDEQIDKDDSIKTIQSKLIKTVTRSYEMTVELIDDDTLDHVIDLLKNANKIYTFGVGASGLVCSDIYFKLSRIGKNIVYHTDSHIQLASLSNATENDLVIGVSYSASTREVNAAFEIAKQRGIPTVSITGQGNGNLDALSTYCLKVPRHEKSIRSAAITSRNDSLFLVDLLYLGLLQKDESRANDILESSYKLTHQLRK